MEKDIYKQAQYLGLENFTKFTNVEGFEELSPETSQILKEIGFYGKENIPPYLKTDAKLKLYSPSLIQIGLLPGEVPICIDSISNAIISFEDNIQYTVNSSIQLYIKCTYLLAFYYREIEYKKVYGTFYENNNYKKYAKKLREMFSDVEVSGIVDFPFWEEQIVEKELGIN